MFPSNSVSVSCFDEIVKTNSVTIPSYLGRLILRTHHEDDTANLALVFSDSFSRRHLSFLQPPNGWGDERERNNNKQWTEQDFLDRVKVQTEARTNGKSCVLNIVLLATASNEKNDRCIGTTGFVKIDGNTGYLGIITHRDTTRMGYATEALYTTIVFAFEKLGINKIVMYTDEKNEEMRGWCEKTAGLKLFGKNPMEINGYAFTECEYQFNLDEWNHSIKKTLEFKMNKINTNEKLSLISTEQ
ncbi:unnamed protein product [Rotaria socialis]|uniref:N-acetyltransferase domain-containing protein n=1 Tax=Rotaria socialis TaxID=392032 RepID=A0A820LDF1_9BILA|nr:unnamed protein product [Rotaria socialis]CAF3368908.1 unnamed protein product [Rotaria socialis]CAF3565331.1 unnamed protein product [Rotaria socialis]CAF4189596.1 unnamed protein product [Rotaria socialis]CAF4355748.1 unnamed protein product [Rotaria socialis]